MKNLALALLIFICQFGWLSAQTSKVDTLLILISEKSATWQFSKNSKVDTGFLLIKNQLLNEIKIVNQGLKITVPAKTDTSLKIEYNRNGNYKINKIENGYIANNPPKNSLKYQVGNGEAIEITPKAAKVTQNVSKLNESYQFIPTEEDELLFVSNTTEMGCCDGIPFKDVPYEIVYNVQDNCRCFFENGKKISKNKFFRLKEGKDLYFRTVGYHPYQDSFKATITFINRNTELEGGIFGLLTQGLPDPAKFFENTIPTKKDTTETNKAQATEISDSTILKKLQAFNIQITAFYVEKHEDPTLSLAFIQKCIKFIKTKVQTQFGCSPEPTLFQKALLKQIDDIKNAELKLATTKLLSESMVTYKKVLTYQTSLSDQPVQIKNTDVTQIKFDIGHLGKITSTTIDLYNKGGFKIDFSAGLVLHGLTDLKYTTVPDTFVKSIINTVAPFDTMKTNIIRGKVTEEHVSKVNIDAGVFLHFYTRNKNYRRFNMSGSIGVVPTKQNEQIRMRYLAGVSFLLGSEQRVVFTVGGIGGKVSRLAENLKIGSIIDSVAGKPNEVPTRDLFRGSIFAAVTFNFASVSPNPKSN